MKIVSGIESRVQDFDDTSLPTFSTLAGMPGTKQSS